MTEERKPTFAMFKATDRKTDKSPEYNLVATCPHCRTEIRGAGWQKQSGKGLDYVGGPVEVKGEPRRTKAQPPATDFNDDIPFSDEVA